LRRNQSNTDDEDCGDDDEEEDGFEEERGENDAYLSTSSRGTNSPCNRDVEDNDNYEEGFEANDRHKKQKNNKQQSLSKPSKFQKTADKKSASSHEALMMNNKFHSINSLIETAAASEKKNASDSIFVSREQQ
jgi:hypothetical protein